MISLEKIDELIKDAVEVWQKDGSMYISEEEINGMYKLRDQINWHIKMQEEIA